MPLRAALLTFAVIAVLAGIAGSLMFAYHLLGTDRTGNDVFFQALKSVRTAFVIGTLATLATLPFAIAFGVAAGYFKGWVDEVIQYLYTLLSSVPNVLLIAACVLMVQVFIDKNPELFATGAERSDLRLFLLCAILGVTGWASLCRLLRAETMKLRELEYVQAATAFGVGHWRIMVRHILPNVMHLVLITTVLEFSGTDPVRGGAVVCRRRRRSVDEQLRRHDQPGAQRDVARPDRLVELRRRVRLHGDAGAGGEPVRRRRAHRVRPALAGLPSAPVPRPRGRGARCADRPPLSSRPTC